MRTPTNVKRLLALGAFAWAAALGGGCSGINASKSVSPLDFILPGLHIRNDVPVPRAPEETNALACRQPTIFNGESPTKSVL